jgi:hypothetical protein
MDTFDPTCVEHHSAQTGEALLVRCSGLIEQTPAFMKANEENGGTDWDDQNLGLVKWFDVGAMRYRWLNTSLFVAKGRLIRTGSIECDVFRVT